nr:glycine-rich protein 2-like [Equus asinus]
MPRPFPPEEAWLRRVRRTSRAASARPQRELGFSFVPTERKVSTAAAKAGRRQEGLRKAAGGGQFPEGTRGRETASPETPGLYRVTSGVRGRKDELGRRRRRGSPIQGAEGLGGVPPSGGASLRAGRRAQGAGRRAEGGGRRAEGGGGRRAGGGEGRGGVSGGGAAAWILSASGTCVSGCFWGGTVSWAASLELPVPGTWFPYSSSSPGRYSAPCLAVTSCRKPALRALPPPPPVSVAAFLRISSHPHRSGAPRVGDAPQRFAR